MSCGNSSATCPEATVAAQAAALRPRADGDPVLYATKLAMRTLGRRVLAIGDDMHDLDVVLAELVDRDRARAARVHGVGVDTAAILLVAAGDNPERIRTEAAWAHLCGVAPLDASIGQRSRRHRLNRGGNRQANHALWRIVFTRMGHDPRTRVYVETPHRRRTHQTRDHARPQALRRPRDLPAASRS